MRTPGESRASLPPRGEAQVELLASAWLSPGSCGHLGSEPAGRKSVSRRFKTEGGASRNIESAVQDLLPSVVLFYTLYVTV